MAQRSIGIIIAVTGIFIVAGLLLLRYDLKRASEKGPRWKRRLVCAGILVLSAMGLVSYSGEDKDKTGTGTTASTGTTTGAADKDEVAETTEWKHIESVWKKAEKITSSEPYSYPFNDEEKKALLADVESLKKDVAALLSAGKINDAQSGLLNKNIEQLMRQIDAYRTKEMQCATCYLSARFIRAEVSMERLSDRMPLIEKLAASEKLSPKVVEKILVSIEKDVAVLSDEKELNKLGEEKRAKAVEIRDAINKHVEKIREKIKGGKSADVKEIFLPGDPDFSIVAKAIDGGAAFLKKYDGKKPEDPKKFDSERDEIEKQLKDAAAALERLAKNDALTAEESGTLKIEISKLTIEISSMPPKKVSCYTPMHLAIRTQSWLDSRLPLLEKMLKENKIREEVVVRIIPDAEKEIEFLSNEKNLEGLSAEEKAEVIKKRDEAKIIIKKIKKRIDIPGPTCYKPMPPKGSFAPEDEFKRLQDRIPLLAKAADAGKITREVADKSADAAQTEINNFPEQKL
jgi:hypothetical protein